MDVREVCRVTVGHPLVTVGYLRATVGNISLNIGYAIGHFKGYYRFPFFFSYLSLRKLRQTQLSLTSK